MQLGGLKIQSPSMQRQSARAGVFVLGFGL